MSMLNVHLDERAFYAELYADELMLDRMPLIREYGS